MLNACAENKHTGNARNRQPALNCASEILFPSSETVSLILLKIYPMGFPQHAVLPIVDARTEVSIS